MLPKFLSLHIFTWPDEAEVVAAERIRASSKKRLLGSCFPAKDEWYKRKCLSRVYILSPLILMASVAMLKTKLMPAINMHHYAESFEAATCKTAASNLTDLVLSCDCRKSSKVKEECKKEYPCFKLSVTVKTKKGLKVTTPLYEDMEALAIKFEGCTVLNMKCPKTDPAHTVQSLYDHYAEEGSSFKCLYNPKEPHEVILHLTELPNSFWAMLVTVSVLLAASVISPIIAYLTCGCMYVCTRQPPPDIVAEVDRRKAEGDPLTEMTPLEPQNQQQGGPQAATTTAPPATDQPNQNPEAEGTAAQQQPLSLEQQVQQQQLLQAQLQQHPMFNMPQTPLLMGHNATLPPPYQRALYNSLPRFPSPVVQGPPTGGSSLPDTASSGNAEDSAGAGLQVPSSPLFQHPQGGATAVAQEQPSAVPPVTILYVHPGNVISTVPPPGVTPLTFLPSPCPSPGPTAPKKPTVLLTNDDEKTEGMFYQ